MRINLHRKPPEKKPQTERLKLCLLGAHTLDDKASMMLMLFYHLQALGFTHADQMDLYLSPVDKDRHPLTHFPDGSLITDHFITIAEPYACAADDYDRKFSKHLPGPQR